MNLTPTTSRSLRILKWVALIYGLFSAVYLVVFFVRFFGYGLSTDPADWANMAGMFGALLGPPVALWSISLVLTSLSLQQHQMETQQRQYDELVERENQRLNPKVTRVVAAQGQTWKDGDLGGRPFSLSVLGDAEWLVSTFPGGPSPVAIKGPDGKIEVLLWQKKANEGHRAFLHYKRSNGTSGWYRIMVLSDERGPHGFGFGFSQASGPLEAEDDLEIEIIEPEGKTEAVK